jgi:hypothetical protein
MLTGLTSEPVLFCNDFRMGINISKNVSASSAMYSSQWSDIYIFKYRLRMFTIGIRLCCTCMRESDMWPAYGCKTAVMDVVGFLCISLSISIVQLHDSLGCRCTYACSEAGFSSQIGDCACRLYYQKAVFCCAFFCGQKDSMQRILIKKNVSCLQWEVFVM